MSLSRPGEGNPLVLHLLPIYGQWEETVWSHSEVSVQGRFGVLLQEAPALGCPEADPLTDHPSGN